NTGDLCLLIAVYSVGAYRGGAWSVASIGIVFLAYSPIFYRPGACDIPCVASWSVYFVFAAIAGNAVREARRLNGELADQTDLLQRTREERIHLAVGAERSRVARDIHDLVGHGVTVMVIQAGAARALYGTDRTGADDALATVETTGAQALRELDALMR